MAISKSGRVGIAILVLLLLIQLIRPAKNQELVASPADLRYHYPPPGDVQHLLDLACYDCHSNNTRYPWYNNIEPVGWWMAYHVNEGKKHLNFSTFGSYPRARLSRMFKHISDQVRNHGMPIASYLWEHTDARLSPAQTRLIVTWADSLEKELAPATPSTR